MVSGRTITAENGTYEISNLSSNSFDITYVGGFDTEVAGVADAELNTHESVIEDLADCNKKRRESSFTFYQPYLWDKENCSVGEGFITTGLAPKSGNIDFVSATATIDMIGKEIIDGSNNLPKEPNDYKEPINETGAYFDTNRPTIKDENGVIQNCLALELTVTNNIDESLKSYKAGKYSKVICDGVSLTGSYTLLFRKKEDLDNHSATIYARRENTNNNGYYTIGLSANDGSYFEIAGNFSFSNVQKNPVSSGWELSMDFEILYDYEASNITAKCVNGYNVSLAELFASEA